MGKWVFTLRGLTLGWQAGLTGKTSKSKGGSGFLIGLASLPACSLFLIRDWLISWVSKAWLLIEKNCCPTTLEHFLAILLLVAKPHCIQLCITWKPRWVMGNMKRCLLIWSTLAFAHVNTQIDKNINGHYLCIRHKIFLWNFHECKNSISDGCSTMVL